MGIQSAPFRSARVRSDEVEREAPENGVRWALGVNQTGMRLRLRPPPRGPRSHFSVWAAHEAASWAAWGQQTTSTEIREFIRFRRLGLCECATV